MTSCSSTSAEWNMVCRALGSARCLIAESSRISSGSSVHPWDRATRSISSRVSESVTYSVFSPLRAASSRNCSASVVFPDPGTPWSRYMAFRGSPPLST